MFRKMCCIKAESVQNRSFMRFMSMSLLVLCLMIVQVAIAGETLIQTGFEEFSDGRPPKDWEVRGEGFEVTKNTAKTDRQSLAILNGANDDYAGVFIETENSVVSVEFWVYIESGGRSFNFRIGTSDNIATNNAGIYVNWNAEQVRCFDGTSWVVMDDFETGKWRHVRFVVHVDKSQFDYYSGEDRDRTLTDKGIKGLPYRTAPEGPVTKSVTFHIYSIAAPGYVDDLIISEGDEPVNLAVDAFGKLTTYWGRLKGY